MKRLIVLAIVGLFVAATAMAQDVTISGEVETRWLNDFNNKAYEQSPEVIVKIDATVDDYNTLYIELEEGPRAEFAGTSKATFPFDKAHFTTDLGGMFMLPVGVTVRTGFDEYDLFDDVKVTFGEWEDVIGDRDYHAWGHEINVNYNDMIMLRTIWDMDPGEEKFGIGVGVTYAPLYVVAGFHTDGAPEEIADGDIEAGLEFIMDDVAAGIDVAAAATLNYDMGPAAGETDWQAGAAVQGTYNDMVSLGVAWKGVQDAEAGALQIDVKVMPVENLTAYLVAGLGLDSDAYPESFDSFEGSLNFMLGASSWYAGLYWAAEESEGVAREKSDFYTNTPDALGIFMRAELKY